MKKDDWLNIGYQNGLIDLDEIEKITFSEVYKNWFNTKRTKNRPSTLDRIECTWNRYFKNSTFIERYTSSITEKDIIDYINMTATCNGTLSKKDMERIYQILHAVLIYARDMDYKGMKLLDWDVIKRNIPKDKIYREQNIETALSNTTVKTLLEAVLITNIYPLKRSAALALCLNFYLGLRIGELAALRFTDFDLERKTVTISRSDIKTYERNTDGIRGDLTYTTADTKTLHAHRTIPLLPEAIYIYELIKMHHKACGYNNPLLVYDGTDTIRIRSLDRTLRRICTLCNIPHFNTHLIRKTFSTHLHYANVPTRVIADLMGHADIKTTENSYILSYSDTYRMYYSYMQNGLTYT